MPRSQLNTDDSFYIEPRSGDRYPLDVPRWCGDGQKPLLINPQPGIGRDEIDRVAGAIKATHPDFQYQPIAEPEELGNAGRVKWVSGRPGEAPAYAGTDFLIARDGRIAALYLFFDELP